VTPTTFATLLDDQVRRAGSRPLVTFYDDATGERVELSVTTYANWVAKTASLLQDELDLERGSTMLVDLPTHWLGPVVLGAAWSVGVVVLPPEMADRPDLVVCGPDPLDRHAGTGVPVLALSLLPMGARFRDPLPSGVVDFGAVVWGQPDAFLPLDPPSAADLVWSDRSGGLTQAELLDQARHGPYAGGDVRLVTDVNPCSRAGLDPLVGPLAAGGGSVWVRHPAEQSWEQRARTEHATVELRQPTRS